MTLPVVIALLHVYVTTNPAIPFAKYLICSEQVDISEQMCLTYKDDVMLSKALQLVCYDLDILQNWNNDFLISNWFTNTLYNDIISMRQNWKEIKDLPEANVIASFNVSLVEATKSLEFNRNHKKWLTKQMILFPTSLAYQEAYWDNEALYLLWVAVKEATDSGYTTKCRRLALGKIREMLGEERWQQRQLLPPIPIWYFSEISS